MARPLPRLRIMLPVRIIMAAPVLLLLGGCATPMTEGPARLEIADVETLTALKSALGEALGRASITLGPEDLSTSGAVSVLPPPPGPLEDRSLAMPVIFDLGIEDGACVAVRRDTGAVAPLRGVRCRPAA